MKKIPLLLAALVVTYPLSAETVILKDGSTIKGKITNVSDSTVYVDNINGTMAISKSNIQTIDYGDAQTTTAPVPVTSETAPPETTPKTAPATTESSKKLFASFDIYSEGGIKDEREDDTNLAVSELQSVGIAASGSTKATPGFGARAGLLLTPSENFEIGGSLGIIAGPTVTQTLNNGPFTILPSGLTFNYEGTTEVKVEPIYVRAMLELGRTIPISKKSFLRLGGGIGIASASVKQTVTASGSASAIFSNEEKTETWSGLTWEIQPSLVFPLGTAELETGLRYSHFPEKKESDDIGKIKWDPFSFFVGVRFGV